MWRRGPGRQGGLEDVEKVVTAHSQSPDAQVQVIRAGAGVRRVGVGARGVLTALGASVQTGGGSHLASSRSTGSQRHASVAACHGPGNGWHQEDAEGHNH